jgi:hypothetical protein
MGNLNFISFQTLIVKLFLGLENLGLNSLDKNGKQKWRKS